MVPDPRLTPAAVEPFADRFLSVAEGKCARLARKWMDGRDGMGAPVFTRAGKYTARGWTEFRYRARPLRRGPASLGACHLREASLMGLWRFQLRAGAPSPVRVFPNFSPVKKYAELAVGHRLSQMGIHRRRRRGEGREFHQLREYREGDSLRQIDWKATARLRRLISKEYQEERDQQVVLLLDCGRRMRGCEPGQEAVSHFDQTLTALLLLSFVALREGDAVGLLTFGSEARWMPPRKGRAALDDLMERLYDLEA